MHKFFTLTLLLLVLLLAACSKSTEPKVSESNIGYLQINNNSDTDIYVQFSDSNIIVHGLQSYRKAVGLYCIDTITYQIDGRYVMKKNYKDVIRAGKTTVKNIESDCGVVSLRNHTYNYLRCSYGTNQIELQEFCIDDIQIPVGNSDTVSVSISIDCQSYYNDYLPVTVIKGHETNETIYPNAGSICFINDTDGLLTVTRDSTEYAIAKDEYKTVKFFMQYDETNADYRLNGDFVRDRNASTAISREYTTPLHVTADSGVIEFLNNTNSDIQLSVSGNNCILAPMTSRAFKYYTYDQANYEVAYSAEGLYLWERTNSRFINANDTDTVNLNADAGALTVINNSGLVIEGIYMYPAGATAWSYQLSAHVSPGSSRTQTVRTGLWDFQITTSDNVHHLIPNQQVTANQTLTINYETR